MKLIKKDSNELVKVGKSIEITNKLIKEIDSRNVVPSDDFRVSIPDVNFQEYLIEEHNLKFIDGTVAYGDIKEITFIRCTSRSIKSIEGIQFFMAINELQCNGNLIVILDVSKNTALTWLNCTENEISSLNVSHNTLLDELDCWDNHITNLDVSLNTRLTRLTCSNNHLDEIDVSKNTALTEFWCSENRLTNLNVTKNKSLYRLDCYENQLTSLDLSQNTLLGDFSCSNNKLTSLDLSNNHLLFHPDLEGNPGDWWKELEK